MQHEGSGKSRQLKCTLLKLLLFQANFTSVRLNEIYKVYVFLFIVLLSNDHLDLMLFVFIKLPQVLHI